MTYEKKTKGSSRAIHNNVNLFVVNNGKEGGEDIVIAVSDARRAEFMSYLEDYVVGVYGEEYEGKDLKEYNFTFFLRDAKKLGFPKVPTKMAHASSMKYIKENTWMFNIRLGKDTEKDLYDYLYPMKGRATYVKSLIREDMRKQKKLKKQQEKEDLK